MREAGPTSLGTSNGSGSPFIACSPLVQGLLTWQSRMADDLGDEIARLDPAAPRGAAAGDRYPDMSTVNR